VGRPERFLPPAGHGRHRRRLEVLADVLGAEVRRPVAADVGVDLLGDLAPDDEDQPLEPGDHCVPGGVVDQGRPARADGGDLLRSAEAGTHAGRQQDEGGSGHAGGAYRAPVPRP
jgi:hypothetical protein